MAYMNKGIGRQDHNINIKMAKKYNNLLVFFKITNLNLE